MLKKEKTDKNTAPEQNWFKRNGSTLILFGVFLIGLLIFLYPSIADYWNSFHQTRAIMSYSETVSKMSSEDYEKEIHEALNYNAELAKEGINWNMSDSDIEVYNDVLNFTGNGNMGYIKIDKIKVMLPFYR